MQAFDILGYSLPCCLGCSALSHQVQPLLAGTVTEAPAPSVAPAVDLNTLWEVQ